MTLNTKSRINQRYYVMHLTIGCNKSDICCSLLKILFECELALLVALQVASSWKGNPEKDSHWNLGKSVTASQLS